MRAGELMLFVEILLEIRVGWPNWGKSSISRLRRVGS